jgi:hypothetical protein
MRAVHATNASGGDTQINPNCAYEERLAANSSKDSSTRWPRKARFATPTPPVCSQVSRRDVHRGPGDRH